MVQTEVNDATFSTRAIIYQLCVALEKCFEMDKEEQKVFIETLGDVTIDGEKQIEVKDISQPLTDNSSAFWNTLKNWAQGNFDPMQYKFLILFTTQEFGEDATISEWNSKTKIEKLDILKEIHAKSEKRFTIKKNKNENHSKPPKSLELQRIILNETDEEKLIEILDRFYIETSSPHLPEYYKKIKMGKLKGIPMKNQDNFLNTLFGFITKPYLEKRKSWEISYEDFTSEVVTLTTFYCKETKYFPSISIPKLTEEDLENYEDYLFVKKIHDIEYSEVVKDAIMDYRKALNVTNEEFKKHSIPPRRIEQFLEDLIRKFNGIYNIHSRNCTNTIKDSKNFYDKITSESSIHLDGFDSTPTYFHNGLLHSELNHKDNELKWRLNIDE